MDALDGLIRGVTRGGKSLRPCRHAEDAPSVRHNLIARLRCAGVEDFCVRQRAGFREARDRFTFGIGAGITTGRHHHADRSRAAPAEFHVSQRSIHARGEKFDEIVLQPREVNLCLRITEARVELDDLGAVLGEHHAGIEQSAKVDAVRRAAFQPRIQNLRAHIGEFGVGQERGRGIGAHAAGVQPEIAVERALVILRRREEFRGLAVAEGVEGNLHPFKKLLNDDARAGAAKGFADQNLVDGPVRLLDVLADENAFAEREPVRLHCATAIERRGEVPGGGGIRKDFRASGGNAVALHEVLRINLRRFELCRLLGWSPDAQAVLLEQIHDAESQ